MSAAYVPIGTFPEIQSQNTINRIVDEFMDPSQTDDFLTIDELSLSDVDFVAVNAYLFDVVCIMFFDVFIDFRNLVMRKSKLYKTTSSVALIQLLKILHQIMIKYVNVLFYVYNMLC